MIAAVLLFSLLAAPADDAAGSRSVGPLVDARTIAGETVYDNARLRTFYARRNRALVWDGASLASLLRALDRLDEDGLSPAHYHRDALLRLPPGAERDVLASDAFFAAATHLARGVVDPQFVRPSWCPPPTRIDLPAVLASAIEDGTVEETLPRLAPRSAGYARLRAALAEYRAIAASGGWNAVPSGRALHLGSEDSRVVALRQRLAREPMSIAPTAHRPAPQSRRFDADLDLAVRDFQARHGIVVDGIVGPETVAELNVSAARRAQQLAVNMERWRWMPEELGASYVVVNIAAFDLTVIEAGRTVLTMKTVVGKGYTRTPFFAARITDVIANPWWNVPTSIAVKELWPRQRRDRSYFEREHIIYSRGLLRQSPGDWNSLGRLKFNMPNSYNVYLHDTPAKQLFEEATRAFSHGCIRIERPLALAMYLLRDQSQWTSAAIEEAIAAGQERAIPLKTPEPVYVLYWTARVEDDGDVTFHRDLYGRDAEVAVALE